MTKYTGITIGPLNSTFCMIRNLRELWCVSFIFSRLMRTALHCLPKDALLIWPRISANGATEGECYPDRIFFVHSLPIEWEEFNESVFAQFSAEIGADKERLAHYFNLMGTSLEMNDRCESRAIEELQKRLDAAELMSRTENPNALTAIRSLMLGNCNRICSLAREKRDILPETLSIVATSEFASNSLYKEIISTRYRNDTELYDALLIKGIPLKSHHTYYCMILADGDNIGRILGNINNETFDQFSKTLFEFGDKARGVIQGYGGLPIYAAADHLMFIAPVVSSGNRNVITLLEEIDSIYEVVVKQANELQTADKVTTGLSFGQVICHYNYPLNEVLKLVTDQLYGKAKKMIGKNAISCMFLHNNGTAHVCGVSKRDRVFKQINRLIDTPIGNEMIETMAYKLSANRALFNLVKRDPDRLSVFLDKYMAEVDNKQFLSVVSETILYMSELESEELISKLYSMLSLTQFIKGEELGDE